MSTKIQSGEEFTHHRGMAKKIRCHKHLLKYAFKCESVGCEAPFLCNSPDCIEGHAHDNGLITLRKFISDEIVNKFDEVDNLVSDDVIYENARALKSYIQTLKESIKGVYGNIKSINNNYDFLKRDLESPLNSQFISRVEQNFTLYENIRKNIDDLKDRTKLEFQVKDCYFGMRTCLIENLNLNIQGFSWAKSQEIYSSKNEPITCEKFHEKLSAYSDLLFVFVGENRIVGSYYPGQYPNLKQSTKKDLRSFLFIFNKEDNIQKFHKFLPDPNAEQHISVDNKNYICHGNTASYGDGIRTFHRNFDTIQYSLPSATYKNKSFSTHQDLQSGTLKIKRFMILQVHRQAKSDVSIQQITVQYHENGKDQVDELE